MLVYIAERVLAHSDQLLHSTETALEALPLILNVLLELPTLSLLVTNMLLVFLQCQTLYLLIYCHPRTQAVALRK